MLNDERVLKESLQKVITIIDSDKDERVTVDELKVWMDAIHKETIRREFSQRLIYLEHALKELKHSQLNWEAYASIVFPAAEMEKQRKRWSTVDENNDGILTKDEFFAFMYPRVSDKHAHLEVKELISMFDKDFDGNLNFDEFYRFIIHNRRRELDPYTPSERQGAEAEYKDYFDKVVDKNKDGFMDYEELRSFLIGDQSLVAAKLLTEHHDEDKSGFLSISEILKTPQHFTRLLPHQFWDALRAKRDEL
ncbi:calumenin-like protein [Leptotrombidium deliense]|uniref:Calumenin-like protein n=1 Tax=Leptotrombidium deliense TaxID=299467 RepID=A0A443S1P8_9ACAR|nr:calumenin-like protein [Leptotrombidium deliense]